MPLRKNKETPENREFWYYIEKTAEEVQRTFPRWKLSEETRRRWNMTEENMNFEESLNTVDTDIRIKILNDISEERARQQGLALDGDTDEFDRGNSRNDWIAYLNAYSGRAAEKVFRNDKEGQDFRANMVKVAALALAALEAHDKGYC